MMSIAAIRLLQLVAQLRSAATNRDVAKQLLDASPALQDKLQTAFGDQGTFDAFMRKPLARPEAKPEQPAVAGVGASPKLNLAFPQMIAAYDTKVDPRTPILSAEEKQVFATKAVPVS